jgi:hypothetical protein
MRKHSFPKTQKTAQEKTKNKNKSAKTYNRARVRKKHALLLRRAPLRRLFLACYKKATTKNICTVSRETMRF